jgi:hypothetical protein
MFGHGQKCEQGGERTTGEREKKKANGQEMGPPKKEVERGFEKNEFKKRRRNVGPRALFYTVFSFFTRERAKRARSVGAESRTKRIQASSREREISALGTAMSLEGQEELRFTLAPSPARS